MIKNVALVRCLEKLGRRRTTTSINVSLSSSFDDLRSNTSGVALAAGFRRRGSQLEYAHVDLAALSTLALSSSAALYYTVYAYFTQVLQDRPRVQLVKYIRKFTERGLTHQRSVKVLMNESIVSKLHSEGILTVYDFMLQKCDALMRKTGLTFKEIEEIREYFSTQFGWEITYPGDLFERESKQKILTGIKNLDALLEGGLGCGTIYEICGSSSAGKSQLCHWLSMHATSNGSAVVHYIDASRNFCASRIQMMLESRHCDDGMIGYVMSNIKVYQICKIYELFNILYSLSKSPDKEQSKSSKRLIIVDSLSVLCAIVSNRDLNPLLCNVAVMCRDIINHSQVVVLIVNTVRSQQAGLFLSKETENNFVLQIKPSLGNYWLNVPNVRLLMTQKENGRRKIAVWNSQELVDEKSCIVQIKDEGVFQI